MTDTTTTTRRDEYTFTRTFDAPREAVFSAWTDPDQFARWWGGTGATSREDVSMEPRVGGEWRAVVRHEGAEYPFSGYFREISPPERLVMTLTDAPTPSPDREHLLTILFKDVDGRTEMHLTQAGDFGEDPEGTKRNMDGGYASFFEALAGLVENR